MTLCVQLQQALATARPPWKHRSYVVFRGMETVQKEIKGGQ